MGGLLLLLLLPIFSAACGQQETAVPNDAASVEGPALVMFYTDG